MATPEWKWLLQRVDDKELIGVARALRLRLTGFRGTRWERNFAAVRPRVVQALLQTKMLPRLRQALNSRVSRDSRLREIRQLSEVELRERLAQEHHPELLLLALLSSPDQEVRLRARRLFEFMRASGDLASWLAVEQQPSTEQERAPSELAALRLEQQAWSDERLTLERRLANLEGELAVCRASAERNVRLWEVERQSLLSRLADRETKLQQREQKLVLFQQGLAEQASKPAQPRSEELPPTSSKSVALIGNISSQQAEIDHNCHLRHIPPREVPQPAAREAMREAAEVWLLTYATPLPIQRLIRREAGERLRCFASYEELLAFAERGGVSDDDEQ